ncbi:MAG: hypothetical protein E7680_00910 [Ruminococcaceae bacterium]|nr:hypothetical protein [Oscillospiraceae bacterium]
MICTPKVRHFWRCIFLEISGLAQSTFYYYLSHPKLDKHESEKQEITNIFQEHKGRYGYRRVLAVMRKNGICINHKVLIYEKEKIDGYYKHTIEIIYNFVGVVEIPDFD